MGGPANRARSASSLTPSGCALMASVIVPIKICYLAGITPSLSMRFRIVMYADE
jgi:hypothetical protein